MTSKPESPHEVPAVEYVCQVRTASVFAFDYNEEVHTSGLSDFHPHKLLVPVTKEPEDLLVTFFRCFLLR